MKGNTICPTIMFEDHATNYQRCLNVNTIANMQLNTMIFKTNCQLWKKHPTYLDRNTQNYKFLQKRTYILIKIMRDMSLIIQHTSITIVSVSQISIRFTDPCREISLKTPPSPPPITRTCSVIINCSKQSNTV